MGWLRRRRQPKDSVDERFLDSEFLVLADVRLASGDDDTPFLPAFTVERRPSWGLFGTPVAPVPFFPVKDKPQQEVPEAFRRKP